MSKKKSVYHGYEERYLTGLEIKKQFAEQYFTTGRHHSVILGISIPEYLDYLGIDDAIAYRIFVNQLFCRIMRSDTGQLISFFGHSSLDCVSLSVTPIEVHLEKICPVCGSPMKFRSGRHGEFLGCSQYPSCRYTTNIPIIGNNKSALK